MNAYEVLMDQADNRIEALIADAYIEGIICGDFETSQQVIDDMFQTSYQAGAGILNLIYYHDIYKFAGEFGAAIDDIIQDAEEQGLLFADADLGPRTIHNMVWFAVEYATHQLAYRLESMVEEPEGACH